MRFLTYTLLLIIGIVLFSCSGGPYRQSLLDIDSICSANPNRAISMLDSMKREMSVAPKREQMYYRLLCIKANDKAYIPHESDTVILPLIEYYEKHGSDKQLSETYYYAGSVYRDLNDAPMALEYFQKALDCMPEDASLRMKSNTCYQIGVLFSRQYLYSKAIDAYKKAYYYDMTLKDTTSMIACLRIIAATYTGNNEKDSSLYYYNRAYNMAKKNNNKEKELDVLGQMSDFYIENGDYEKAKRCLLPTLYVDTININANYCMASDIYMCTEQYDSAKYYCMRLIDLGTIHAKHEACRHLIKIYLHEGDYTNMTKYLDLYEQYTDSVNKITATESIAQMNAMYDYQIREKENAHLKAERSMSLLIFTLAAVACCIIMLLLIIYNIRTKQKRERLELQVNTLKQIEKERFEQSDEFIKENNKKIEQLELQLSTAYDETATLKRQLEEQKSDLLFANEKAGREIARKNVIMEKLVASDVHGIVSNRLEHGKNLTKKEWEYVDTSINDIVENFKTRLYSLYRISEQEYRLCLLVRLGFNITEISSLLNRSASAISLARKRLYLKIFEKEGSASDFDDFVKSL